MPRSSIIGTSRSGEGGAFSLPSSYSVFTRELSWSPEQTGGGGGEIYCPERLEVNFLSRASVLCLCFLK